MKGTRVKILERTQNQSKKWNKKMNSAANGFIDKTLKPGHRAQKEKKKKYRKRTVVLVWTYLMGVPKVKKVPKLRKIIRHN